MPFEKGQSGNPAGRKAGTPNTINRDLRERISDLLESRFDQVAADLDSLEPKERLNAWLKMSEFILPKQRELGGTLKLKKQEVYLYVLPDGSKIEL